eukprot:7505130-Pyramimonas_sp.AAC.1
MASSLSLALQRQGLQLNGLLAFRETIVPLRHSSTEAHGDHRLLNRPCVRVHASVRSPPPVAACQS